MNYFTNESPSQRDERDDACEHVMNGATCINVHCERDSFGYVERFRECIECRVMRSAEEAAQREWCNDGKHEVRRDLGIMWRSWDFYPPQGDEALFVCLDCCDKPRHRTRVDRDAREHTECAEDESSAHDPFDDDYNDTYPLEDDDEGAMLSASE